MEKKLLLAKLLLTILLLLAALEMFIAYKK